MQNSRLAKSKQSALCAALCVACCVSPALHGSDGHAEHHKHQNSQHDTHHSGKNAEHDGHGLLEVTHHAPKIHNLEVKKLAESTWRISFETDNFSFSEENADGPHVDNQGHAHIYVNGKKISRLYSNEHTFDNLDAGRHKLRVTLNTNDHKQYAVHGKLVEVSAMIGEGDTHDAHDAHDKETD